MKKARSSAPFPFKPRAKSENRRHDKPATQVRNIRDLRSSQTFPARNLLLPTGARYRVKACGSKPLFQRRSLPSAPHCEGSASFWPLSQTIPGERNGHLPCRQDERHYNQPGQQYARYKRKRRLQWMRLEMAASLC